MTIARIVYGPCIKGQGQHARLYEGNFRVLYTRRASLLPVGSLFDADAYLCPYRLKTTIRCRTPAYGSSRPSGTDDEHEHEHKAHPHRDPDGARGRYLLQLPCRRPSQPTESNVIQYMSYCTVCRYMVVSLTARLFDYDGLIDALVGRVAAHAGAHSESRHSASKVVVKVRRIPPDMLRVRR